MRTEVVKSVSFCLLTGFAFGLVLYLCKRKRDKSEDTHIDIKTSTPKPINPDDEDKPIAVQSDSYHSVISVPSELSISSSSLFTCTSLSTDTSTDEREKKTTICGIDLEDEEHESNTLQDFETQLSSPVVVPHGTIMETWQTPSVVIIQEVPFEPDHMEHDNKENVVPEYHDSYQSRSNTYNIYNKINQPNSPFTAWYVSK